MENFAGFLSGEIQQSYSYLVHEHGHDKHEKPTDSPTRETPGTQCCSSIPKACPDPADETRETPGTQCCSVLPDACLPPHPHKHAPQHAGWFAGL